MCGRRSCLKGVDARGEGRREDKTRQDGKGGEKEEAKLSGPGAGPVEGADLPVASASCQPSGWIGGLNGRKVEKGGQRRTLATGHRESQ